MNKWRIVNIFYFSGTGNAKQIALWCSEMAIEKGIDCQLFNMAETEPESIDYIKQQHLIIKKSGYCKNHLIHIAYTLYILGTV
jgi:flavodoxin